MAGGVIQIGLTSLWSPNCSEVPGRLILCFCQKKTPALCSPVPKMNLWSVFSVGEVIGSTVLFWLAPVGCPLFSSCCYCVPQWQQWMDMEAFGRSVAPAELNPRKECIFFSWYATLEVVIPLVGTSGTLLAKTFAVMVIGRLWRFGYPNCCSIASPTTERW